MEKVGGRKLSILCSLIMSFSIFISSFAKNFTTFCIFYGVFYGIFQGLILNIPIYIGYLYFPDKKGRVTGIILSGFGVGNLVLSQISFRLINPLD
jgi:MFS family permease